MLGSYLRGAHVSETWSHPGCVPCPALGHWDQKSSLLSLEPAFVCLASSHHYVLLCNFSVSTSPQKHMNPLGVRKRTHTVTTLYITLRHPFPGDHASQSGRVPLQHQPQELCWLNLKVPSTHWCLNALSFVHLLSNSEFPSVLIWKLGGKRLQGTQAGKSLSPGWDLGPSLLSHQDCCFHSALKRALKGKALHGPSLLGGKSPP